MNWASKLTAAGAMLPPATDVPHAVNSLTRALELNSTYIVDPNNPDDDKWVKLAAAVAAADEALQGRLWGTTSQIRYDLTVGRNRARSAIPTSISRMLRQI